MSANGDNFDNQPDNFIAWTIEEDDSLTVAGSRDATIARTAQGHYQMTIGTGLAFGDFEMNGFAVDAGATGLSMTAALNPPNNNVIDLFYRDPANGTLTDPAQGQVSIRRVAHANG